jgi:hypothetical protein
MPAKKTTNNKIITNPMQQQVTTTEEEDNITTTEDETTQDSEYEMPATTLAGRAMPPIQEVQAEEIRSEEESDSEEESESSYVDTEHEIQFVKALLLEQLGTQTTARIAPGTYLYLLTGHALTKFIRLTKYHVYGNQLLPDIATKLAVDIARTQQVVAPLSAVNTQEGELFVIDDIYQLMALRNLSDGVLEKLTVMLVVYEIRALGDPMAKALFTRLNTRQQFTIDIRTQTDIEQFMSRVLAHPAFKDGVKSSTANKKANFPHISATELRKSLQEIIAQLQADGSKANIELLANRLIDFNCICKGKPISTLFGLHVSGGGSVYTGDAIDDKTRERYKKMVAKDFYLASPYGRCWPQFLLGRSDTELVTVPKGSSAPVIPVVSQKLSFSLKKS